MSATSLADLKGKSVAIVEGYSYGDAIDDAGPRAVRSRSEEDSLERLLAGGVDYTLHLHVSLVSARGPGSGRGEGPHRGAGVVVLR